MYSWVKIAYIIFGSQAILGVCALFSRLANFRNAFFCKHAFCVFIYTPPCQNRTFFLIDSENMIEIVSLRVITSAIEIKATYVHNLLGGGKEGEHLLSLVGNLFCNQ